MAGGSSCRVVRPAGHPAPIPHVPPAGTSHAVLLLASDEARYITGLQLEVDADALLATTTSGAPHPTTRRHP